MIFYMLGSCVLLQGGLSSFVQSLRMECIDLLVEMEARLDFDDEMPILDTNALIGRVETMSQHLQQALATAGRGHLLQSGLQVINCPLIPSFLSVVSLFVVFGYFLHSQASVLSFTSLQSLHLLAIYSVMRASCWCVCMCVCVPGCYCWEAKCGQVKPFECLEPSR
jgi:hypothetical protein